MAFLNQLQGRLASLKESPHLQQLSKLKEGAAAHVESALKAKDGLINKATAQFDSLGKILNVSVDRRQSPIDIVPVITAFGEHLQNAEFRASYASTGDFRAINSGSGLQIHREGNDHELSVSFIPDQQYHLDIVGWHWGTEPMNGSEHTIGGVGYAGELHLIHRNVAHPNLEVALKAPDGVIAVALFLNESHDENPAIAPFINVLGNVTYKGNECRINSFPFNDLFPPAEKCKEFWLYDGSETVEPFRETVRWIVFRSALPISSYQLDRLREVRSGGFDEENERPMVPLRAVQSAGSRTLLSSFRSAANAPNLGFNS